MQLSQIAQAVGGSVAGDDPGGDRIVSAISAVSSEVSSGTLFVALKGSRSDGHSYIDEAYARGAVACLVERGELLKGRRGIVVRDTRAVWSRVCASFYGNPARDLKVALVTGTNGKTTTHWLLANLLEQISGPALRVGTLGAFARGVVDQPDTLTTPDAKFLHATLRAAVAGGAQYAVMEASSHALQQHRLDDLAPNVGIFTNLTRDHLDYHGDMESYLRAKLRLFDLVAQANRPERAAVVHLDAPFGDRAARYARDLGLTVWGVGRQPDATIQIVDFRQSLSGTELTLRIEGALIELHSPLIGSYNAENLAGVIAAARVFGIATADIAGWVPRLPPVPGRLQPVPAEGVGVFIDYAHTPDALENVLTALRQIPHRRLWALFGCGGDRDRGKRPLMGQIAARLADKVVVTTDNPRTEDAQQIINDILSSGITAYRVEPDRRQAIHASIAELEPGDLLCIAGKGHEEYQIIGSSKVHFSDVEEARAALVQRGSVPTGALMSEPKGAAQGGRHGAISVAR